MRSPVRQRLLERRNRRLGAQVAQEAHDQLRGDAVAALAVAHRRPQPSITVSNGIPRAVCACGSKNISACTTPCRARAREVRVGELGEIRFGAQHRHRRIVEVEERLQTGELVRRAAAHRPTRTAASRGCARRARTISSGSSVPSMCRCSSALGSRNASVPASALRRVGGDPVPRDVDAAADPHVLVLLDVVQEPFERRGSAGPARPDACAVRPTSSSATSSLRGRARRTHP